MKTLRSIIRDDHGGAVVEMAFAVPVLALMLWGIFEIGVMFQANAGMQHALGEGARYATICVNPNVSTGCGAHTDIEIRDHVSAAAFGVGIGNFSTPSVTTPASTVCTKCRLVSVTYTMTPNFLFFNGPPISLTRSKLVYLAN